MLVRVNRYPKNRLASQKISPGNTRPHPTMRGLLLPLLIAGAPLVSGDIVRLASCPQEPDVVGVYKNDGKKCVRSRTATDRISIAHGATCPTGTKYRNGKCRSPLGMAEDDKEKAVAPTCEEGYKAYGDTCRERCRKGYQQTATQCILPQATLPMYLMTCPEGHRRVDAFCMDDHVECHDVSAPGTFHYKDGKCERSRLVVSRTYTTLRVGQKECPSGKVMVRKGSNRYCQDPCPEHHKTLKGKCELRKCVVKADQSDTHITCPEGKFMIPLVSV